MIKKRVMTTDPINVTIPVDRDDWERAGKIGINRASVVREAINRELTAQDRALSKQQK